MGVTDIKPKRIWLDYDTNKIVFEFHKQGKYIVVRIDCSEHNLDALNNATLGMIINGAEDWTPKEKVSK